MRNQKPGCHRKTPYAVQRKCVNAVRVCNAAPVLIYARGVQNCPTFQIIAPSLRTVEGTRYCDEQPVSNCHCCDAEYNEITQCPRDANLPWNTDTCACGSCSKEKVVACGAVYSTGKLYDDRGS